MKLTTIKIQKQKLERWKMIEGYSNYMVSSLGRVKSLGNDKNRKEKILKPRFNTDGYLFVTLYKNGKRKMFLVHRLVALAFIPNPNNKPQVNHIDENKTNNNVKNLEWVTSKENCNWGTRNKRHSEAVKGEKHLRARKVKCVETGEIFDCIKYACEWSGLKGTSNIIEQIQKKRKSAGKHPITKEKLHWEYVVEETIETNLNLSLISNINISI